MPLICIFGPCDLVSALNIFNELVNSICFLKISTFNVVSNFSAPLHSFLEVLLVHLGTLEIKKENSTPDSGPIFRNSLPDNNYFKLSGTTKAIH